MGPLNGTLSASNPFGDAQSPSLELKLWRCFHNHGVEGCGCDARWGFEEPVMTVAPDGDGRRVDHVNTQIYHISPHVQVVHSCPHHPGTGWVHLFNRTWLQYRRTVPGLSGAAALLIGDVIFPCIVVVRRTSRFSSQRESRSCISEAPGNERGSQLHLACRASNSPTR
jgi:hypothetical protein